MTWRPTGPEQSKGGSRVRGALLVFICFLQCILPLLSLPPALLSHLPLMSLPSSPLTCSRESLRPQESGLRPSCLTRTAGSSRPPRTRQEKQCIAERF